MKQKENLLFIGISTLLCYLELHPQRWIENLVSVYGTCKVQCYGGPSQLQAVAQKVALIVFFLLRGGKMTHIQVLYLLTKEFHIPQPFHFVFGVKHQMIGKVPKGLSNPLPPP